MKLFSKILILSIIITSLNIVYGDELNRTDKTGYELYKHRTQLVCDKYKKNNPIYQTKEYINFEKENVSENIIVGSDLDQAKELYRENMNNIYKCGLIGVKLNSYNTISNYLIKNNAELNSKVGKKIINEKQKLNLESKALKCRNTKNIKGLNIKKQILDQTTYELCRYNFYLEYLKEKNQKDFTGNIRPEDKENGSIGINKLVERSNDKIILINNEIENSYDVFPIAYNAYSDYENSITTHLLLEIVKYDYAILRDKMHQALSPINQVVYKISNAMKP